MLELFSIDYTQWELLIYFKYSLQHIVSAKIKLKKKRIFYGCNLIIYIRMMTCVKIDENTSHMYAVL